MAATRRSNAAPTRPASTAARGSKESEYLQQLQEKQKARFSYGVMEKQFRRYYEVGATFERLVAADEVDTQATRLAGDGAGIPSHVLLPTFPL